MLERISSEFYERANMKYAKKQAGKMTHRARILVRDPLPKYLRREWRAMLDEVTASPMGEVVANEFVRVCNTPGGAIWKREIRAITIMHEVEYLAICAKYRTLFEKIAKVSKKRDRRVPRK